MKGDAEGWLEIDRDGPLKMVDDKSFSKELREAVYFRLREEDPGNTAENIVSSYLDYIEKVFIPKYCCSL